MAVVLIVEDDEQVRTLAGSILEEAGHKTLCAATATEANAIVESDEKIDVLLVDLSLLDYQEAGLEVAQAAAKTRQGLPVIYTTGRGVTDGMLALFVERNVFLAKPYRVEELPHRRRERFEIAYIAFELNRATGALMEEERPNPPATPSRANRPAPLRPTALVRLGTTYLGMMVRMATNNPFRPNQFILRC